MSYAFESRGQRALRSILAICGGTAVHAGVIAGALVRAEPEVEVDDLGGPMVVELAAMAVAPQAEAIEAPIGPRQDETPPSPPTPVETEIAKTVEAPPLPTTAYEPEDPELRFARDNPDRKVEDAPEDAETKDKIEQASSAPSAAVTETTAPPAVAAPPAETLAAPNAGLSEADVQTIARWQRRVVVHLNRFKQYPGTARQARVEGNVQIVFRMDREGRVVERRVMTTSGAAMLDEAALEILKKAEPLPSPPPEMRGTTFELMLPIEYRVKS